MALGAFYRCLAARIGKAKAVTATARKIAILFYNAMRFGMSYQDPGGDHYEQKYRERVLKGLYRRPAEFGFTLQPADGALLLEPEDGAGLAARLRQRDRGDTGHRGLLQQHSAPLKAGPPATLLLRAGIG